MGADWIVALYRTFSLNLIHNQIAPVRLIQATGGIEGGRASFEVGLSHLLQGSRGSFPGDTGQIERDER